MEKGRWIVRGASLALVLGFFMPAVLVSCSGGFVNTSQPFSLADIANQLNQSILYLLPIMAITAAILSFLHGNSVAQQVAYMWGQLGAITIGLIVTVSSLLSVNSQISNGSFGLFKVTPSFGVFILGGGAIAFIIGWVMQKQAFGNLSYEHHQEEFSPYQERIPESAHQAGNFQGNHPYLDLIAGNLPVNKIPIPSDNFAIGRSSDNHLRLPDPAVSRVHVLLRLAQGVWFLQDQESSGGTFVNGNATQATRLNEGDEISIGPFRFKFHSGEY